MWVVKSFGAEKNGQSTPLKRVQKHVSTETYKRSAHSFKI